MRSTDTLELSSVIVLNTLVEGLPDVQKESREKRSWWYTAMACPMLDRTAY
jgi:hypothetical protein